MLSSELLIESHLFLDLVFEQFLFIELFINLSVFLILVEIYSSFVVGKMVAG